MSRWFQSWTLSGGIYAASHRLKAGQCGLADFYDFPTSFNKQIPRHCTRRRIGALHSRGFAQRHSQAVSSTACSYNARTRSRSRGLVGDGGHQQRQFHNYFVTHLPSSSLHPDSRSPHHKLPRSSSTPHTPGSGPTPAAPPPMADLAREMTVVRIPLRSAKHHFGVSLSRGMRPYNEDTYQAGVIEIPAFAKRSPMSLTKGAQSGEGTSAESASGDPQVFYFGVFDGHGGNECSDFLREELHTYIEDAARQFGLQSSLKKEGLELGSRGQPMGASDNQSSSPTNASVTKEKSKNPRPEALERSLVLKWKDVVGGYFRRFKPEYFSVGSGAQRQAAEDERTKSRQIASSPEKDRGEASIETVMTYAFLKADLDFVSAQAWKKDEDAVQAERPLNEGDVLGKPSWSKGQIGGPKRFKGGSTCSVALISTPSLTPFWHPASPSTLLTVHVGDTRILLCSTASGQAIPLTTNHHPSSPVEGNRLRKYAASFVTDSFGEERMSGLANTRAFGDMQSKRLGVSAEPEIKRVELGPAQYSFLVLVSDGVSGTLNDQEIVDIVKEARTPEQGAKDVVSFATEVSKEGDNSTCLVVRLGGWERRSEGGVGSMGTKESRDWRRQDATNPRSRRT